MADMIKLATFDLDGCLADDRRRLHLLPEEGKTTQDWDEYHQDCGNDPTMNWEYVQRAAEKGLKITFVTARPERFWTETGRWLERHCGDIGFKLLMRPNNDMRPSPELKVDLINRYIKNLDPVEVMVAEAYDDRDDVVQEYIREYGAGQVLTYPSEDSQDVPAILRAMARTFEERNKLYGPAYIRFGKVAAALWPSGLTINSPEDFARHGVIIQVLNKLLRYTAKTEGHKDSAHDLAVYAAMLESITE
jgi:hypothetical protein